MPKTLTLSVHELVDFLLRSGDINSFIYSSNAMQEGVRLHSIHQRSQDSSYLPEYFLKHTFSVDDYLVTLEGRADGVILGKTPTIQEIKSSVIDIDLFKEEQEEWHIGQAKCYALMLAYELGVEFVNVSLLYIYQLNPSIRKDYLYHFYVPELEQFVTSLIREYLSFQNIMLLKNMRRNDSIKALDFPFSDLREGQNLMMNEVKNAIEGKYRLFIEAPTGIGKTMAAIYPSLKELEQDKIDRIFYLTAKGSGKSSVQQALRQLEEKGLDITCVTLTAKEKICLNDIKACVPSKCMYALGYYTKLFSVLKEAFLTHSVFDEETILKIAKEKMVCPFELQLDISTFTSFIIGDYNYFFDPGAYLRRHFDEESENHLVLVDEAHNLIDRAREMYSASFDLHDLIKAKDDFKHLGRKKLNGAFKNLVKYLEELSASQDDYSEVKVDSLPSELILKIELFNEAMVYFLNKYEEDASEKMLDIYYNFLNFFAIKEKMNDTYIQYFEKKNNNHFIVHLYTVDAHDYVLEMLNRVNTTIFYSGTLTPMEYYISCLSNNDLNITIPSPFPKENFLFMAYPHLSLRYKDRENSLEEVKNLILEACGHKLANYLVFVPSYEYLNQLKNAIGEQENYQIYYQKKEMNAEEVNTFLTKFKRSPKKTTIGIAVLGGVFAEGVDLSEDRLSGVIVISVGIAPPALAREEMKKYYDEKYIENGYAYAYVNPGIMKILQAFGRVIRSPSDQGFALLIDHRALWKGYRDVFLSKYGRIERVDGLANLAILLERFWHR